MPCIKQVFSDNITTKELFWKTKLMDTLSKSWAV